ncbi:aminotransferase class I/II-fold pyridoxal phosphate-dependent enzyme [Altererythrobacter confluentis]|uniref:Histidinol-phosphate aminotransferase n=1 Tax=Allopontixanthobacter confluentis TaxID=1849021 RepID=A0A6L7GIA1_9SPHN|nr:histidinol-phosphate transaminase [Allopontixanthobacter confluentis]MXP15783.1 aminotransferase class I/II-fold pyridoxal phosphate-dependent enzyme [Allopontixanthobacter confluentis]
MAKHPTPKPWIADIHAYVPGKAHGADGRELVKLSANENPLGSSAAALGVLGTAGQPALYPDPDCNALRAQIGALHGLAADRILCGAGSGELLHCAVQAFCGVGDEVVFSRFSFSLYPLLARKVGASPVFAADHDYAASVDNLLANVTPRTKAVLLDNPNNPVGSWLPREEVERLHAGLPGHVLLIVDQAYAEYLAPELDDGGLELAARHDNVLVTRTFSKAYGLAAERVGWATGSPRLIDYLNRLRGAFNVTSRGQAAALAAVGDQDFVAASRAHNTQELARFTQFVEALGNHGLRPVPSKANFLLVLFEGAVTAEMAQNALADAGYATRWLPGQDLPHGLRITIGTAAQMDDVMAALRTLLDQG